MSIRSSVARLTRDFVVDPTFDDIWESGVVGEEQRFHADQLPELPLAVRRYLLHAIAPGARLATVVRLQMHGTIKLKGTWYPFEADQVLHCRMGFVWRAKVHTKYVTITGSDRWVDGDGAMRWNIGWLPMLRARGDDISRSSLGRGQIEAIWNPCSLLANDARWTASGGEDASVRLRLAEHPAHLEFTLDSVGRLRSVRASRWGNPDGGRKFREHAFGALATAEHTFDGITIPTALRVGWYVGTDRFESEGEFFRCTVDNAEFR